jgi:hypothetical protein
MLFPIPIGKQSIMKAIAVTAMFLLGALNLSVLSQDYHPYLPADRVKPGPPTGGRGETSAENSDDSAAETAEKDWVIGTSWKIQRPNGETGAITFADEKILNESWTDYDFWWYRLDSKTIIYLWGKRQYNRLTFNPDRVTLIMNDGQEGTLIE